MNLVEALIADGIVRPEDAGKLKASMNKWLQSQIDGGNIIEINRQLNLYKFTSPQSRHNKLKR